MSLRIHDPSQGQPEENLLGQFIPLHYHFNMLRDARRVEAFRRAIERQVHPGMNVVELGGGTGILSFFAARQGARVWCVERNPELARTAQRLLRRNRVDHLVQVIEADAAEYVPPEPVGVVICEMLHAAVLRERQLNVIQAFKRRYRDAYGDRPLTFVPDSTLLAFQPIEHAFEFSGYHAPIPLFQDPAEHQEQTRPLAELKTYAQVFYDQDFPIRFRFVGRIAADDGGQMNALRFLTHNLVGCEDARTAIPWTNQLLVMPLDEPKPVARGQSIEVAFDYASGSPLSALADSMSVSVRQATAPVQHRRRAA